jgi:serine/threonine-protein kinase
MGEVFRATDELLGRPVAVKLLLPTDRDPRAADRFHREARAAAMLNDTHVVAVYDFGQHGDSFFLVMELVEGGTVAGELAEHGTLPIERALEIVEQSAAGLAAAHQHDVVHRDVKPGNLLLAADGTVKVADFGIAQVPGEGGTTLTAAGQIIGSALYLSPERARGEQAGKAADVYALGCVLYQLVTGQPPFTAEHPTGILYQHVDTPPVPPSTIRPEFGEPYEAMLLRMLAKDPADRPTAAEIAVDPPTPVAPLMPVGTTEPPLVAEPSERNRRKVLLAAAVAIIAAAAAGVGIALMNGDDGTKLPATTDVGPRPGVSTPATTPTAPQSGTSNPTNSTDPSQGASTPATPRPSTPSPSSTPSRNTPSASPSPSEPSPSSSPPPSSSPRPSPSATPSSSPSPENPPTNTPPANTPTPETLGQQTLGQQTTSPRD